MMREPPGEPTTISSFLPDLSKTKTGDMDERGRLPASTRLAINPFLSLSEKEKSVN